MNIKEFQCLVGLTPDGVAGPKTVAKAQEVLNCIGNIYNTNQYVSNKIQVAGKIIPDKCFTINGSTYAKVRPILENTGNSKVDWDNNSKTVIITSI